MTSASPPTPHSPLPELEARGLLKDITDRDALDEHLEGTPRKIYAGFDPTATSLTIGNLVPIMLLARLKRAGHHAVVVMGGGTGLIGDPSGKSAERQLLDRETIEHHVECQRPIFDAVLSKVEGPSHDIKNNIEWLDGMKFLDVLRDIGKHFSVNTMMRTDSVRDRLENRDQGISYTEFSYAVLQATDFLHLYQDDDVTVQCGGSDQYGNILAGIELIRRTVALDSLDEMRQTFVNRPGMQGHELAVEIDIETSFNRPFGFTVPLVTKADGGKFGKTESGAVWLTADRTSPYAYFQFWLNTTDADLPVFLKTFTFLPLDEIEALLARHAENPGKREAQRTLAREATTILHGEDAMTQAEAAGKALFSGEITGLDEATLTDLFADVPSSEHPKATLSSGVDPVELLVETGLAKSKREARDFVKDGSVSVNGTKLAEGDTLTTDHLLHGSILALRRGKKAWHVTRWA